MYPLGWEEEFARERIAEARAEVEKIRLARLAAGPRLTMRARMSRKLFQAAVALERDETWRAVWERLEAPRHP
ncbi:MAG: hypothetical protein ACR2JR_08980 [Rubrobacteraceae bacterium]